MTNRIIAPGLAVILLAGAAILGIGESANAAGNATMTACSQQWQANKKAGTVPQGETWSKFYSQCAADMKKGAVSTATAPDTTAPIKKTRKAAAVKPPPAESDTPGFVPQEPAANDQTATMTTDARGKPLSAGEVAFRKRIHECGTEWRQDEANGSLPAGEKWPQFWSACNTRLKTQG